MYVKDNQTTATNRLSGNYYFGRSAVTIGVMLVVTLLVLLAPEMAKWAGNSIFSLATHTLGGSVMLIVLIYFLIILWLCFSKYGNIRLGEGKPEYSTWAWFAMLFCASSATASAYWAFNEWPALYTYMQGEFLTGGGANALGGMLTEEAKVELARAYNFADWGPINYCAQSCAAVPMAYYFYNKRKNSWAFDVSCQRVIKKKWFGSFISTMGLLATFTALAYSTSLGVDLISEPLCYVLGIEPSFAFKVGMMIFVSVLFTLTSYVGVGKGMKRISNLGAYVAIGVCIYILLFSGYGVNIINSTISSLGLAANNYLRVTTWLEPYESSGMAQNWPIFYAFSFTMYAPFVGAFIGKISKGRSIKQIALVSIFGAFAGFLLIHGVIGGYVAELMFAGKVDVLALATAGAGPEMVIQTLMQLPLGKVIIIAFVVMAILFLATTMDAGAHTLASGMKKTFKDGEETSPMVRFLWCIAVSVYPLGLVFINADIQTIKSLTMIIAFPVFFMIIVQIISFIKDLKDDYGHKSAQAILDENSFE